MTTFTVTTDGTPRYYTSGMEAILRYAEAKDKCTDRASVYRQSTRTSDTAGWAFTPQVLASFYKDLDGKGPGKENLYVPLSEWL